MAMRAIKEFFDNFSPQHIFLVITHADLSVPDDKTLNDKIASISKWGGFEIKRENVILFNNTSESLQPLLDKITRGNMTFT
jgi:hypothetical protein